MDNLLEFLEMAKETSNIIQNIDLDYFSFNNEDYPLYSESDNNNWDEKGE